MAGRFGGSLEHPRQSWRAPYQIRKEKRIARERMKIPVCQSCGVRCTVCAPKFGQPARCCLIVERKPEMSSTVCNRCGRPYADHPTKTRFDFFAGQNKWYQVDDDCTIVNRKTGSERMRAAGEIRERILHVRIRFDSLGRQWAQHKCGRWMPAWSTTGYATCRYCNEHYIAQEGYPFTTIKKEKPE